jgi:hypothetical protein
MRRVDPDRHFQLPRCHLGATTSRFRFHWPLCLLGAAALGLAAPSTGRVLLALGEDAGRGLPSPAELAGRYERTSPAGTYVDVHGPFTGVEAQLVAGYRDPVGRPFVAPR